jgi:hypothetical protein
MLPQIKKRRRHLKSLFSDTPLAKGVSKTGE